MALHADVVVAFQTMCPEFPPTEIGKDGLKDGYRKKMGGERQGIHRHFHPTMVLEIAWTCIQMLDFPTVSAIVGY